MDLQRLISRYAPKVRVWHETRDNSTLARRLSTMDDATHVRPPLGQTRLPYRTILSDVRLAWHSERNYHMAATINYQVLKTHD